MNVQFRFNFFHVLDKNITKNVGKHVVNMLHGPHLHAIVYCIMTGEKNLGEKKAVLMMFVHKVYSIYTS